ncbi:hypothetical protein [Streptomyces hesseae]|uniref:Transposase n=1 Tax=Streptomyces hesseae TaxID=3075519 RepID=A0ABU2SF78_9ACTN|nr:hypothetical protein [Streptomyces sp. DSM 40473]MDT0447639.1 hypothetical protein [Streptomyces sp. DSM 40473]
MIVKGSQIQWIRRCAPRRHPLADQVYDALTVVIVVIVVAACSPGLSPEALGLIGTVATVLGSRSRPRTCR